MEDKNYSADFSENSFWDKLRNAGRSVGREIVEKLLSMYYALQDKDTPLWAKTVIVAALGYFICPIDAIPDVIPGAGYADDAGAIAAALGAVAIHITTQHKARAKKKADDWFGPDTGPDEAGAAANVRPPKQPRTSSDAKEFPSESSEA